MHITHYFQLTLTTLFILIFFVCFCSLSRVYWAVQLIPFLQFTLFYCLDTQKILNSHVDKNVTLSRAFSVCEQRQCYVKPCEESPCLKNGVVFRFIDDYVEKEAKHLPWAMSWTSCLLFVGAVVSFSTTFSSDWSTQEKKGQHKRRKVSLATRTPSVPQDHIHVQPSQNLKLRRAKSTVHETANHYKLNSLVSMQQRAFVKSCKIKTATRWQSVSDIDVVYTNACLTICSE